MAVFPQAFYTNASTTLRNSFSPVEQQAYNSWHNADVAKW